MNDEICLYCKYWVERDALEPQEHDTIGTCRRYPPQTLPQGSVCPFTRDCDFCGEFEKK